MFSLKIVISSFSNFQFCSCWRKHDSGNRLWGFQSLVPPQTTMFPCPRLSPLGLHLSALSASHSFCQACCMLPCLCSAMMDFIPVEPQTKIDSSFLSITVATTKQQIRYEYSSLLIHQTQQVVVSLKLNAVQSSILFFKKHMYYLTTYHCIMYFGWILSL